MEHNVPLIATIAAGFGLAYGCTVRKHGADGLQRGFSLTFLNEADDRVDHLRGYPPNEREKP